MPAPAATDTAIATCEPLRILLVDDHAIVREGIRTVLEQFADMRVVGEFGSGDEAVAGCAELAADFAIVDLKMRGLGPVDTIIGLRRQLPQIRILVFTSFGEEALIRAVCAAGAGDWLLKDALQEDLVRTIRQVANAAAAQPPLLRAPPSRLVAREVLTPRETAVMRLIARGKSNKLIGRALDLTEGTVKGYVSQILAKLQLADRTQVALYAVHNGLVGEPPPR